MLSEADGNPTSLRFSVRRLSFDTRPRSPDAAKPFDPSTRMKTLYVLGPRGTYSERAARQIGRANGEYDVRLTQTIPEISLRLEKDPQSFGLIPIENRISGAVAVSQNMLIESDVRICLECSLEVSFSCLCDLADWNEVKIVFAHSEASNQCSKFIAGHFREAQTVHARSNADSAEKFFEARDRGYGHAAIVPSPLAKQLEREGRLERPAIEVDFPVKNTTRFLKIVPEDGSPFDFFLPKTSIYIPNEDDRHSLLYEILGEFHRHGINLVFLHSRPNLKKEGAYSFFIDFQNSDGAEDCLKALGRKITEIRILGTYGCVK